MYVTDVNKNIVKKNTATNTVIFHGTYTARPISRYWNRKWSNSARRCEGESVHLGCIQRSRGGITKTSIRVRKRDGIHCTKIKTNIGGILGHFLNWNGWFICFPENIKNPILRRYCPIEVFTTQQINIKTSPIVLRSTNIFF